MTRSRELAELASAYDGGGSLSFRNRIINGDFDIWQRGTSNAVSGYFYVADRWLSYGYGGTNTTFSQQAFSVGQTDVPNNPKYFTRLVCTNNRPYLEQRVENVGQFSGQQVTVSLWVKSSNITANIQLGFYVYHGSSGSAATGSGDLDTGFAVTSNWQKLTYTYTVPSMIGKTIAGGNDYLGVNITLPNNVIGTLDIAQVQLDFGSVATPFERRPYGTELALCQRYYQVVDLNGQPVNIYPNSANAYTQAQLLTEMRAAPTTVYDTSIANSGVVHYNNTTTNVTFANNVSPTSKSVSVMAARVSGAYSSVNEYCGHIYIRIRASAEL